jgi:hypothetical protein
MCRSIKCLANFEPPASEDEIRESAVQFVRKLSGARRPSRTNEAVFNGAVEDVTEAAARVSGRWHAARASRREALLRIEGEERFEGLQQFFAVVHRLTTERRLSRVAYLVEKRAD